MHIKIIVLKAVSGLTEFEFHFDTRHDYIIAGNEKRLLDEKMEAEKKQKLEENQNSVQQPKVASLQNFNNMSSSFVASTSTPQVNGQITNSSQQSTGERNISNLGKSNSSVKTNNFASCNENNPMSNGFSPHNDVRPMPFHQSRSMGASQPVGINPYIKNGRI